VSARIPLDEPTAMNRQRYERSIQLARIVTALLFTLGGIGLVICANLRLQSESFGFVVVIFVSLALLVFLILEQLASAWFATCRGRISLASLLLLTSAACVFFAVFRNSFSLAIVFLSVVLTIAAVCVESRRERRTDDTT